MKKIDVTEEVLKRIITEIITEKMLDRKCIEEHTKAIKENTAAIKKETIAKNRMCDMIEKQEADEDPWKQSDSDAE